MVDIAFSLIFCGLTCFLSICVAYTFSDGNIFLTFRSKDCDIGILIEKIPSSNFCCDSLPSKVVCTLLNSRLERYLVSLSGAILLPFVPLFISLCSVFILSKMTRYPTNVRSFVNRFTLYFLIILFRTVVYYFASKY